MGKKIKVIMLMTLLSAPLIAVGADNKEPANDQPAVSASISNRMLMTAMT